MIRNFRFIARFCTSLPPSLGDRGPGTPTLHRRGNIADKVAVTPSRSPLRIRRSSFLDNGCGIAEFSHEYA
jgi:hypothetical protein